MKLTARDFPCGTPLRHFFRWNEGKWFPDRRYRWARDADRCPPEATRRLATAVGNPDVAAHAAVFVAFEEIDTAALHDGRQRQHILVIRLSAFGDFIQSLGPFAGIRRHHRGDQITLLTTRPFAEFAAQLGYFDAVLIDERPGPLALGGWLRLRRRLRQRDFDRVYDLQTSRRSSAYAWLLRPGMPQWSGIAWRCSHPHANRGRDPQHTLDKQAEQLLMAGIYPTPLPELPSSLARELPAELRGRPFILLVPGSSPRHVAKRWPAERFGAVAAALADDGYTPVIVGLAVEAPLAAEIRTVCSAALDLVGRTDIALLAALSGCARLTIGNDSGVCHLAAAAGCPLIVLFSRETDPLRCAPRGRARIAVVAEANLEDLAVERVISVARDILNETERALPATPSRPTATAAATAMPKG